jgi:uncharacterized membrane protein
MSRSYFPMICLIGLVGIASAVVSHYWAQGLLLVIFFLLGSTAFFVLARSDGTRRDELFMVLIMLMSIGLLMSSTSISENLHGYDINEEFAVFTQVLTSGAWQGEANRAPLYNQYSSTLSVSVLPSILSIVSGLNGFQVFMFVFPLVFSLAPLILYVINRNILPPEGAFLSAFLFMSYPAFYVDLIQVIKQAIAEIMLLLLLWILLSRKSLQKRPAVVATVLLTIGIAISHYSLAFIYVALLGFSLVLSRISGRVAFPSLNTLLVAGLLVFGWYLFSAGGNVVNIITQFVLFVTRGLLTTFFNPASRPLAVNQALGLAYVTPGLLHDINRFTQYFVQFAMILGLVVFVLRKNKNPTEQKDTLFMVFGFLLLGSAVVLPRFAGGLELSRFYHISLIFISSCFVIGTERIESYLRKLFSTLAFHRVPKHIRFSRTGLLAAAILFSYLLYTSGWVWAVSMDPPVSLLLDRGRMLNDPSSQTLYYSELIAPQDIAAATWLGSRAASGQSVCSDFISLHHVLTSYGGFTSIEPELPSECEFFSYIYLSVLNTRYGIGTAQNYTWPVSQIYSGLIAENRVYSNGGAVVYVPP